MVQPKQMVATVKIIPFAVRRQSLDACLAASPAPARCSASRPFSASASSLIQTRLARPQGQHPRQDGRDHARASRRARQHASSRAARATTPPSRLAAHRAGAVAERCGAGPGRRRLRHHRPARRHPGGDRLGGRRHRAFRHARRSRQSPADGPARRTVPVLGLPGCARSPKVNGFDWVLQRLLAGLPVGADEIRRMGVGGLLADIPSRPMSRSQLAAATAAPRAPANRGAGAGRRPIAPDGHAQQAPHSHRRQAHGAPCRRCRRRLGCSPLVVVTGHERDQVEAALAGLEARFVHNPDYAQGLSTSVTARARGAAGRKATAPWSASATCRWSRLRRSTASSPPSIRSRAAPSACPPAAASAATRYSWRSRFFRSWRAFRGRYRRPRPDRGPSRARGRGRDGERRRAHRHRHAAGPGQARRDRENRRLRGFAPRGNKSGARFVIGKIRKRDRRRPLP